MEATQDASPGPAESGVIAAWKKHIGSSRPLNMKRIGADCPSQKKNTVHFDSHVLGGGFKYFLFSPLLGNMIQFDYCIFFRWVETTNYFCFLILHILHARRCGFCLKHSMVYRCAKDIQEPGASTLSLSS